MTITIQTDASGKDTIWSELAGKAVPLEVERIHFRAVDGHARIAPSGAPVLDEPRPHEIPMIEHWMRERGVEIAPGGAAEKPLATPEAEEHGDDTVPEEEAPVG